MIYKFLFFLLILPVLSFSGVNCSLINKLNPDCFQKRVEARLNIALLYYGEQMIEEELQDIGDRLKEEFKKSTRNLISLNVKDIKRISFEDKLPKNFQIPGVHDEEDLMNLWHHGFYRGNLISKVYEVYKKRVSQKKLKEIDAIVVITSAQFEDLALSYGRLAVIEYPTYGRWGHPGEMVIFYPSQTMLVDTLIHEVGHILGLKHSSEECFDLETEEQRAQCCAEDPNSEGVMSHCRNRYSPEVVHEFSQCQIENIEKSILPSLLKGKKHQALFREKC